ncbi:MAG: glycosyltransferase family 1 protein [Patescibacteria group bacterium]
MLVYQGSGVATYTFNAAKALLTYDHKNKYVFFYASLRRPHHFTYLKELKTLGAKIVEVPIPTRLLRLVWNRFHLFPVEWFIGKVDIYFSSDYLRPPLLPSTKGIATVHDMIWFKFPQFHTRDIVKIHARKMEKLLKYQDTILVDSVNSQRDLLKLYPVISASKIHVIYPGVDDRFSPKSATAVKNVLTKYSLPLSPYLIYIGAIEPRKNLDKAIKIFSDLIKNKSYSNFNFIIAGRAGWKNEHIHKLVYTLQLTDKVLFPGFIEENDISALYSGAKVCIYLSEYEGFGLPPLEAAKCDTPTLLYSHSSLKELFPKNYPYTTIGRELATLINLIESGRQLPLISYADKFSWELFTKKFVKIISEI